MAFEDQALRQFNRLVEAGELLWTETEPRSVPSTPFHFQFRVAASLAKKPMTATQKKVDNAFADESPLFSLGQVGNRHKLILNKYCVVRPQFVLHTIDFEPQQQALSKSDSSALWEALARFSDDYFAIFNCGADAGASVGHKHMQILPHPGREYFTLFPDASPLRAGIHSLPKIPFQHGLQMLPKDCDAEVLSKIYSDVLSYLALGDTSPHNVVLVKRWILVIPRTTGRVNDIAANAAAMVGIVWMTTENEFQDWTKQDPMTHLPSFGVSNLGD